MVINISISKTHIEKFFQEDLDSIPVNVHSTCFHEIKYTFLSELISIFYLHSTYSFLDGFHNALNILADIPDTRFEKEIFTGGRKGGKSRAYQDNNKGLNIPLNERLNYDIDSYLILLDKVRFLVAYCKGLNEKAELCKLERRLMLIYLKELNRN